MKLFLYGLFCLFSIGSAGQEPAHSIERKSIFNNVKSGDSITVYQCHVDIVHETLTTSSGQTFTTAGKKCTITEKYVIQRQGDKFLLSYYTTSLNVFPNRKFSGLKIREKPYWQFVTRGAKELTQDDIAIFLALEKKGHEATEFDYGITKYNTNQVIFKHGRNFKQLVITTDHVISKLMGL